MSLMDSAALAIVGTLASDLNSEIAATSIDTGKLARDQCKMGSTDQIG